MHVSLLNLWLLQRRRMAPPASAPTVPRGLPPHEGPPPPPFSGLQAPPLAPSLFPWRCARRPARPRRLLRAPRSGLGAPASPLRQRPPRRGSAEQGQSRLGRAGAEPPQRDGPEPGRPREEQAPPPSLPPARPQTRVCSRRYGVGGPAPRSWRPSDAPISLAAAAETGPLPAEPPRPGLDAPLGGFSGPSAPSDPRKSHQSGLRGSLSQLRVDCAKCRLTGMSAESGRSIC